MKAFKAGVAALSLTALGGTAQAALIDRGNGMVYDTVNKLTWLADFNYAKTSGYAAEGVLHDGRMSWAAANQWADQLVYGGFDDWRLPTLNLSDTSCDGSMFTEGWDPVYFGGTCKGGELSRLFATDFGAKPDSSVLDQTGDTAKQIANLAMFSNVQELGYWSGTPDPFHADLAWGLHTWSHYQGHFSKQFEFHVVAVRANVVPEPGALTLSLLSLGAAIAARKRQLRAKRTN